MDRIERHDVLNAAFLAVIVMGLALTFLYGARTLLDAVGGETVTAGGSEGENASGPLASIDDDSATATTEVTSTTVASTTTTTAPTTTTTEAVVHSPADVITRVGNGADNKGGIAGKASSILAQAGYKTLSAKNADTIERSVVYYQPGFQLDGEAVALLLEVPTDNILPMPDDPGIPINEAHLVIILGQDTTIVG